ncbi:hypothetical protein ALNOE001_08160 [Candidatus Methanobinarius endosymbioticus]|uniref:Uncharacterized protein n=1 Tax=Candidatus Methanobinarius endosymbioticus TaxID=2006182 RepID=A0A366MDP0_9EURY|nr:hypothetical protein ALNOE001_08160 [Candidatus Methanobinarius endosymbioticus]
MVPIIGSSMISITTIGTPVFFISALTGLLLDFLLSLLFDFFVFSLVGVSD